MAEAERKRIEPIINSDAGKRVVAARKAQEHPTDTAPDDKLRTANRDDIVPAISLYNLYNGNEVAGEKQYSGKVVIVEGAVQSVEKGGVLSATQILLQGRLGRIAVAAKLTGAAARSPSLESVQHGSVVRVQDTCKGKMILGTVELSDCTFVLAIE